MAAVHHGGPQMYPWQQPETADMARNRLHPQPSTPDVDSRPMDAVNRCWDCVKHRHTICTGMDDEPPVGTGGPCECEHDDTTPMKTCPYCPEDEDD